jgi:hypothetical protein
VRLARAPADATVRGNCSWYESKVFHLLIPEHLGGHLKPDPLSRAASVLETHGKEIAEHVASFETRQVDAIKDLVQREKIDCDFEETKVTDVCLYNGGRDKIKADIAKLVEADISTAKGIKYSSDSEAEKV